MSPMEKPARRSLLPGVADAGVPPAIVFDSRAVIVRARRRALLRDALDLVLLLCVDGLFLGWPRTHVPLLGRDDSLLALAALNGLMIVILWISRTLPRWRARRVATTWCPDERARFFKL
jgi:hypothetical protein